MDDWQLIQSYTSNRSEEAFSQLVARHLGLVYSTALRRLNSDSHLAQDVAQLVFTNLARKAHQLGPHVILAGWLHKDTCFTALAVLRKETRRRARENAAFAMHHLSADPTPDDWLEIAPFLDETLQQLPARDRDALLLRFFEQQSLGEIGQRLGIGESGASRCVNRALEKLRHLLARRRVITTTAALSLAISTHAAASAPAALVPVITTASLSAALSATTGLGILTVMTSIKLKIGIGLVIAAAITLPLALKYSIQSRQSAEDEYRRLEIEHVQQAGQCMTALITFAGDHENKLPKSLTEVGLSDDQFQLTATVLPGDIGLLASTEVIREKRAWKTPRGTWARASGYADGHSQIQTVSKD